MNCKILTKYTSFILRNIFCWLVRNNHYFVIALLYKMFAIKIKKNGNNSQAAVSGKITILAISADKFRGDPECLAQVSKFRVLTLHGNWVRRLVIAFTDKKLSLKEYINAEAGDDIYSLKERINAFFDGFISSLLKLIKVDCVITHNYRYMDDFPWVMSFTKKRIPHICLYREGLVAYDRAYVNLIDRHRQFIGYPVTHIIVQNQKAKDCFVESGFVTEEQVSVFGALRMDNLLKQVNVGKGGPICKYKKRRKRVILFYFNFKMGLFGKGKGTLSEVEKIYGSEFSYVDEIWPHRYDLFRDLHISIIRLAQKLPEVDFVIRPKRELIVKKNWNEYLGMVNEIDVDLSKLENYTIDPDANTHDLILHSDVVIALQTSTVLEAAIAGKPVIFPLFYNYKEARHFNDFCWRNNLDLFDVAESAEELEALVVEGLEDSEIGKKTMEGRRELFKEWFSDLDGVALKKYSEIIEKVVASAKIKEQHSQSKSIEHGLEKSF